MCPLYRSCVHCTIHVSIFYLCFRDVLFQHFQSGEEGTRNVVAECVGKLTLADPDILLPKLKVN